MAHAYHDELGLPAVTVHPFNVFGPGQIGGGAIRAFIENALAGRDLVIHGDGSQIRAWCYVDDMVEGTLACLEHPAAPGQTFNIGNPRATVTIYDLAQRIRRLTGADVEITFQPLHYADVELRIPNVEKAREVLGFEAKVDLDEGLEKTIAWYREKALSPIRLAFPRARGGGAGGGARGLRVGRADDGPEGGGARGARRGRLRRRARGRRLERHRRAPPRRARARDRRGRRGDRPAYTFPATANVVRLAGATPVLVDVDPATFNLDLAQVYDAVTPRTKAVLAVHLFGRPLDWEALQSAVPPEVRAARGRRRRARREVARDAVRRPRRRGLPLLPPAQDRHDRRGRRRDDERRRARGLGPAAAPPRDRRGADIVEPSTNYRLADILCAIGIPQLRRLDELLAERTRIAEGYTERLRDLVDVPDADEGDTHGWQAYVIRLDRKDEALETLRAEGIEVQIGTYALHRLSAYRDQGPFPGADAAFDRALALPLHSRLTDADLDRVAEGIAVSLDKRVVSEYSLPMSTTTTRQTAEERREAVLEAAARRVLPQGPPRRLDRRDREGRRDLAALPLPASSGRRRSSTSRRRAEDGGDPTRRSSGRRAARRGQEALHAMGDAYRS